MITLAWDERVRLSLNDTDFVEALTSLHLRGKLSDDIMELIDNEALEHTATRLMAQDDWGQI